MPKIGRHYIFYYLAPSQYEGFMGLVVEFEWNGHTIVEISSRMV